MLDVRVIRSYNKRWPEVLNSINRKFLPEAGQVVLKNAQRNLRANGSVDTGDLRASLTYKVSKDQVSVGSPLKYAAPVEFGSRPHTINSAVKIKGSWVYIKDHPGSVAKPYLRPALDQNRRELVGRWRSLFRKTFRALGKL